LCQAYGADIKNHVFCGKRLRGGLATVVFYRDYMVNFSKGNQKGKSDEKTKNSKKHGGTLEDDPNAGRKKKKVSGKHSGTGEFLYGLRRRKGKPENVERVSEDTEEYSSTTRFLESSLGIKSYAELAPYLAKGVERVMAEIIDCKPTELTVTPDLICKLHKDAFGELFPSWAGRYRDRDVVVGKYNKNRDRYLCSVLQEEKGTGILSKAEEIEIVKMFDL